MSDRDPPSNSVILRISRAIDTLNDALCKLVSGFTLIMVLLTFAIVVLRYGFNLGWIAMQESVMYLHGAVFMLGAAHTLRVNEHVRVDIFYRAMTARNKARVDALGSLLLLLPVSVFIFIISFEYVSDSWSMLEDSQAAGGLPLVFVLKSFILLFSATMVLQGISETCKHTLSLSQGGKD